MVAIVSLLIVLSISFLITRIGSTALALTGVSRELARLQSISAFTGVGFTTHESEHIVRHPVRRRIIIVLMILGNAGFVTAISSLVLSFGGVDRAEGVVRVLWLAGGIGVLWLVATSRWIESRLSVAVGAALKRWSRVEARDYASLLQLTGEYTVMEVEVSPGDWVAGQDLKDLSLRDEGVNVLGIHRADGSYVGSPVGSTTVEEGDRLVLYGRGTCLEELNLRKRGVGGDAAHEEAVASQERVEAKQEMREDARRSRGGEPPEGAAA